MYTETCIESMQNVKKEGIVMALWGKTGTKGQNKYSKKCPNKPWKVWEHSCFDGKEMA